MKGDRHGQHNMQGDRGKCNEEAPIYGSRAVLAALQSNQHIGIHLCTGQGIAPHGEAADCHNDVEEDDKKVGSPGKTHQSPCQNSARMKVHEQSWQDVDATEGKHHRVPAQRQSFEIRHKGPLDAATGIFQARAQSGRPGGEGRDHHHDCTNGRTQGTQSCQDKGLLHGCHQDAGNEFQGGGQENDLTLGQPLHLVHLFQLHGVDSNQHQENGTNSNQHQGLQDERQDAAGDA
mmetsp:Transcript_1770/g.4126  ORF Transcript_1770/g.4126 Transcript_1770/m.4126 type:complete len:233 (-) Transcript_1770:314-1012(-)